MREVTNGEPMDRRRVLGRIVAFGVSLLGSRAWAQGRVAAGAAEPWDPNFELVVNFEIGDPEGSGTRRAYVAVYVEDMEGKIVKTMAIWAKRSNYSWLADVRRWFRAESARLRAENKRPFPTISGATRKGGSYRVRWDGTDSNGNPVEQGRYVILVETARQSGGNYLTRKDFEFGTTPFTAELEPNGDIRGVSLDYHQRA